MTVLQNFASLLLPVSVNTISICWITTVDSTSKSSTKITNKVLDDLLDKTEKKSQITNSVLNDLLKKDDTSTTYDSSAKKNTAADATAIDQTV